MQEQQQQLNQQEQQDNKIKQNEKINIFDFLQINWPKNIQKYLIKYRVIEIQEDFINYILEDGVYIHEKYYRNLQYDREDQEEDKEENQQKNQNNIEKIQKDTKQNIQTIENKEQQKNINQQKEDESESDEEKNQNRFKTFDYIEQQFKLIIEEFENCFLKLNWKAPLDCKICMPGLKINHIEDLFLAIKNSNLLKDLVLDYKDQITNNNKFHIILRKWYEIDEEKEFRCFIFNKKLIAICQRHTGDYYQDLQIPKFQQNFQQLIETFFSENLETQFPYNNFILDVYIDKPPNQKIWIIDLNPWREFTNPLLFTYEELEQQTDFVFKVVSDQDSTVVQDYSAYRTPVEVQGGYAEEMVEILQMMHSKDKTQFQNKFQ